MIRRTIADRIKKTAKKMPVISITGPRQSGKTMLVKKLFRKYDYVNLENPDTKHFALSDPRAFL